MSDAPTDQPAPMKHIMVDLETLGILPGSIILSIGAVPFCAARGIVGDEQFYRIISTDSCKRHNLREDAETRAWWMEQPFEVRGVIDLAEICEASLIEVLNGFNAFVESFGPDVHIWGNGADFDNAALQVAYARAGLKPAWNFRTNRCFRTLRGLRPDIRVERSGARHNALDDAVTQARCAAAIFQSLPADMKGALR